MLMHSALSYDACCQTADFQVSHDAKISASPNYPTLRLLYMEPNSYVFLCFV